MAARRNRGSTWRRSGEPERDGGRADGGWARDVERAQRELGESPDRCVQSGRRVKVVGAAISGGIGGAGLFRESGAVRARGEGRGEPFIVRPSGQSGAERRRSQAGAGPRPQEPDGAPQRG
jgi:hypothetical protein